MSLPQTANATASGDPTHTRDLRQAFVAEVARRFRRLRGMVRQTVGYANDALALTQANGGGVTDNAEPQEEFDFFSDSGRVNQFYIWVKRALREDVLGIAGTQTVERGEHWTARYIRDAYLQGYDQATGLLFQAGASVDNPSRDTVLNLPVPESQLRRLYTRAYEDLKDITAAAAEVMREELTKGLAAGDNPRAIADRLTDELSDIQHRRAETYARTTIVDSHSTATLDRYESAGVTVVSHGEWTTAGDDRVCPICEAMEGREYTTQEMRETRFEMDGVDFEVRLQPPAHPNGRCVIRPVVGGTAPDTPLDDRLPDKPANQAANARVVA